MSRNSHLIDISYTDDSINTVLSGTNSKGPSGEKTPTTELVHCWYNHNEDQFLNLKKPIHIPSFPVHHDIDKNIPPPGYTEKIQNLCINIMEQYPSLIENTKWFFNPISILSPSFYKIISLENTEYLYICMIDLTCRPLEVEMLEKGSNNSTHQFRTNRIYFECDFFPLKKRKDNLLELDQIIPATWKGEAGQGYMVHGIWMDSDINKFFSKLVLPLGKRNHPYYPITCKQHCISMNAWGIQTPEDLHRIKSYITPQLEQILQELQIIPFSEKSELFASIKKDIPPLYEDRWKKISVTPYLNDMDQKEYHVEF